MHLGKERGNSLRKMKHTLFKNMVAFSNQQKA